MATNTPQPIQAVTKKHRVPKKPWPALEPLLQFHNNKALYGPIAQKWDEWYQMNWSEPKSRKVDKIKQTTKAIEDLKKITNDETRPKEERDEADKNIKLIENALRGEGDGEHGDVEMKGSGSNSGRRKRRRPAINRKEVEENLEYVRGYISQLPDENEEVEKVLSVLDEIYDTVVEAFQSSNDATPDTN